MLKYEEAFYNWMIAHVDDYKERGETNPTALAEACADRFDLYDDDEPEDFNIPEWVYDLSMKTAEKYGVIF